MSAITHLPHGGTRRRSQGSRLSSPALGDEGGFTIVEVLVSAIVVVMIAIATFGAITTAGRTAAETRRAAQAYGVAQQDQARMRTFKVSSLSNYAATRTVTVDNTPYSVTSQGEFVTDSTGTATCGGSASADYISIASTVTWPSRGSKPPVTIRSIVSPPNGTIGADRGALAVKTVDSRNGPLAGVRITGSGPATFTDVTDTSGCVLFGNLPAGTYTITPSSTTTLVNKDGNAPSPQTTSVVAQSTNTLTLQYDRPGNINVRFETRSSPIGSMIDSSSDTVMVFNSGMTAPKRFGTLNVRPAAGATFTAGPLFPFTSPDTVYAGACAANNPVATPPTMSQAVARPAPTVPINGTVTVTQKIQLPALYLTVRTGTGSSSPGSLVSGGRVTITDPNCSNAKRTFTTTASGTLPNPGLPYGTYNICADNGTRRQTANSVVVKNGITGTSLTLYLSGSGSAVGVCP